MAVTSMVGYISHMMLKEPLRSEAINSPSSHGWTIPLTSLLLLLLLAVVAGPEPSPPARVEWCTPARRKTCSARKAVASCTTGVADCLADLQAALDLLCARDRVDLCYTEVPRRKRILVLGRPPLDTAAVELYHAGARSYSLLYYGKYCRNFGPGQ